MSVKNQIAAFAAAATLACMSFAAFAEDHPYSEGVVVNVTRIRTMDGHFDEYMKWLDTGWKRSQELAKKAGYIVSYQVVATEPRTPEEPDLLLIVTYKNWAALDGALAKGDDITKQLGQTNDQANKEQADRGKIRTILGSETVQVLDLK